MTYTFTPTYDTAHELIDWLSDKRVFWVRKKQEVSNFFAAIFVISIFIAIFLISIPIIRLILNIFIHFFIPKINLQIPTIPLDKDRYVDFRNLYDTLDKDIDKLRKIQSDFQHQKVSFWITNGITRDFEKIINAFVGWHTEIKTALDAMNFPKNVSTEPFHTITEEEHWKNRNPAYKYLI